MTGKHNVPRDRSAIGGDPLLIGSVPQDELEGMVAEEILAAHGAAMDHYRRAAGSGQLYARHQEVGMAYRLSRTFAALVGTLHHHRSHASQKATVTHLHEQARDAGAKGAR